MIQRLLSNLLDNAIKYTPSGGSVTVSLEEQEENLVIIVKDTGIGISPSDLPRIFERFYRCDQSRSLEGIGLGLSLARAIARAHGGDIMAVSEPNAGSTFRVILPKSPPSPAAEPLPQPNQLVIFRSSSDHLPDLSFHQRIYRHPKSSISTKEEQHGT